MLWVTQPPKFKEGRPYGKERSKKKKDGGTNSKGEGQPIEAQILILIFNPVVSLKEKTQKDEL
jgi:hypothetical protein